MAKAAPAWENISIHAPLRERRCLILYLIVICLISIHAPLRERPATAKNFEAEAADFNPRSLAGATKANDWAIRCVHISIHAPLRERRTTASVYFIITLFQSTLPCGSDQRLTHLSYTSLDDFNPRSLAGATDLCKRRPAPCYISIHAPLRERPSIKDRTANISL